jgi:hypothetical protein
VWQIRRDSQTTFNWRGAKQLAQVRSAAAHDGMPYLTYVKKSPHSVARLRIYENSA